MEHGQVVRQQVLVPLFRADELGLGVKCHSKPELAGSPLDFALLKGTSALTIPSPSTKTIGKRISRSSFREDRIREILLIASFSISPGKRVRGDFLVSSSH
ncbi:Hypothetical predicted protein [Olea europaea subsp. europaea]|uniref:Uncharacterized protein n=1 Tax=Olea europaea subsp. europaea TaxID=158383 RepID=A0A8S0S594_OLEEU|nr:Hypothetical predicted protein [Olea europaea subsp. europaea]